MMVFRSLVFISLAIFSNSLFADEYNNMEKINTAQNEFAPSVNHDGKFMLFNSKRGKDKYMDIFISHFKNEMWSTPVKFDILNSSYNDETAFISRDGKIIVFSSDRDGSRELKLGKGKTMVSYDLYWSHKTDEGWSTPEPIPGEINSSHHEKAPSLSADNQTLYFTRWISGKMENASIMSAQFINDEFEKPQTMPKEINSGNRELALVPDGQGSGYYFSSAREGGFGGWDIYYVSSRQGQLGMPINLGGKINSNYDEAFFSIINGRIFFCSDKPRDATDFDILNAYLPGEKQLYFAIADEMGNPMNVRVDLHKIFGEKVPEVVKQKSGTSGTFSEIIPDDLESIDVFIEESGYLPFYKKIEKQDLANPLVEINLKPIKTNSSFSIEAIHFDYEKDEIKPESFPYLNRLAKTLVNYMADNEQLKVQIIGHTDLHGDDSFNLKLSQARAENVAKYLVKKGVDADRLNTSGMGKTQPVINERNAHADRLNRRTEFRIQGI